MRILVTGAGGFLGADLVEELRMAGHQVRRLVSKASTVNDDDGNVIVGDIRDASCVSSAMTGCDCVVHLAGKAHALDDEGVSEADYQSVNVEGTRRLLEKAKAGGVRKFVFASSVKVFGETTLGCVDEAAPAVPRSPYARSKWSAEQLVASFASGALTTVSFRLPLVYGPTEKGNLFRMIAAIDRGRFPPLPHVAALRSMLHVKNFGLAVRAALEVDAFPRPMYVIADAAPYSITGIYDHLREGLGRRPPVCRVPGWALSFGAKCGDLLQALTRRPFPFSSSTREKLMGQACYSPDAAMRELHYRPLYTFEQAVPDLITHYRRSLA
jgi:nucleoside-diphosphate-sugar epimerase